HAARAPHPPLLPPVPLRADRAPLPGALDSRPGDRDRDGACGAHLVLLAGRAGALGPPSLRDLRAGLALRRPPVDPPRSARAPTPGTKPPPRLDRRDRRAGGAGRAENGGAIGLRLQG